MGNVITLLVALAQPCALHPDFVPLFTPLEYRYTGGGYRDELFRYRLFIPTPGGAAEKRPLIVWLHGLGEAGSDNVDHLRWLDTLIFRAPWQRQRFPFFLLAVQCPEKNRIWTRSEPPNDDGRRTDDDMVNVLSAILDETLRNYPIDRDRIYLAGVSSGGSGCWELAIRHPEYFAAAAPLASMGPQNPRFDRLVNIPIWVFYSTRDVGIQGVRTTVQSLKDAGGNVHLTEIESPFHDCWTAAFEQYDLLHWLLSQSRGQASHVNPPGTISLSRQMQRFFAGWQWWEILLQAAIPVTLMVVISLVWKRRRQRLGRQRPGASDETPVATT